MITDLFVFICRLRGLAELIVEGDTTLDLAACTGAWDGVCRRGGSLDRTNLVVIRLSTGNASIVAET
jgi:hypothetical protein